MSDWHRPCSISIPDAIHLNKNNSKEKTTTKKSERFLHIRRFGLLDGKFGRIPVAFVFAYT